MDTNSTTLYALHNYSDYFSFSAVRYVAISFFIIGNVTAVIGNLLVLLLVWKRRSLRQNATIIFIVNLALCDLISSVIYRPLFLVDLLLPFTSDTSKHYTNKNYCKTSTFFQAIFAAVGFHTIVAISLERFILIVYPLKAKSACSIGRAKKILFCIWFTALMCTLPIPIYFAEIRVLNMSNGNVLHYCSILGKQYSKAANQYYIFLFTFYFALPLIQISVSYWCIFMTLFKNSENTPSAPSRAVRLRKNLAKMMLWVAVLFAICNGPSFLFSLFMSLGYNVHNVVFISTIVEFLPIISSATNPFIYTLNSKTFRHGLQLLVCRGRNRHRDSSLAHEEWKTENNRRQTAL